MAGSISTYNIYKDYPSGFDVTFLNTFYINNFITCIVADKIKN